jgi:hypothetical protein
MEYIMRNIVKKMLFPVIGFMALLWFLIRVLPKPSRATYPCMKAAAPIAFSFVVWATGLFSSILFFKKAKKYFVQSRYVLFSMASIISIVLFLIPLMQDTQPVNAVYLTTLEAPNTPMGEGKGIFPGRVVWVHDPDATDETCKNTNGDYWYQDDNTIQSVVDQMLSDGLQEMTGTTSDAAAWDAIFHSYNSTHGRGDVGYTAGEKIVIKINLNGEGNSNPSANVNNAPQLCYLILDQLVNVAGVAQADIGIGDPSHMDYYGWGNTPKPTMCYYWDKCKAGFPNVKYWGNETGMTLTPASAEEVLFSSDGGINDKLPQCYLDATYMINFPVLKKHHRAGITLCAKNHFGSTAQYYGGAWQWHPSLPSPDATGVATNGEYGVYRCLVDLLGHKDLGGKTILYLADAIWGSVNWGHPPVKYRMAPFNNDWPNSLFLSQDPVAIESVAFDFLYYEFDENHPTEGGAPTSDKGPFPHFAGTDDHLHQAADPANWPADFEYDPEADGTVLTSLGTHEHWNNALEKKYSRNLGTGNGIELVYVISSSGCDNDCRGIGPIADFHLYPNYPNPFNPETHIQYQLNVPSHVVLTIYQINGQQVRKLHDGYKNAGIHIQEWNGILESGLPAPSGVYIYKILVQNSQGSFQESRKMVLNR